MADLLAFCPSHGLFAIPSPASGAGTIVVRRGSTLCPQCGATVRLLDAEYRQFAEHLEIILDPQLAPEIRSALVELFRRVKDKETTVEAAQEEAAKIDPGFRRLFNIRDWSDQAKAQFYSAVIGAAALVGVALITNSRASAPTRTVNIHIEQTINVPPEPTPIPLLSEQLKKALKSSTTMNRLPPIPHHKPTRKQ